MESGADVGLCFGGVPALRGGKLPFLVSSMESYDVVDEKLAPLAHMYQRNTLADVGLCFGGVPTLRRTSPAKP